MDFEPFHKFPVLEPFQHVVPLTKAEFQTANIELNVFGVPLLTDAVAIPIDGTCCRNYVYIWRDDLSPYLKCSSCKPIDGLGTDYESYLELKQVVRKDSSKFMLNTGFYYCNNTKFHPNGTSQPCGFNVYPLYTRNDLVARLNDLNQDPPYIVRCLK